MRRTDGAFPLNNTCILTRERERGSQRGGQRQSMNGLGGHFIGSSKGRPRDGNKRSQHVLSQTVPSHKSDSSSWLIEDGMILILSRWKPTNTTTSLCFNKKSARTDGRARSAETTNCCSITAVHVKHTGRPRLPLSDSSWGRWLPATRASEDFWWTKDTQRRDKRSFHQI